MKMAPYITAQAAAIALRQEKAREDNNTLRRLVPAHMLELCCNRLHRIGMELRKDYEQKLHLSMASALGKRDMLEVRRLAKECDRISMEMLRGYDEDRPQPILLACCYMILWMVDERLHPDANDQSVLFALSITAEAEESPETWGIDKDKVVKIASEFMTRARDSGLFRTNFLLS